MTQFDNHQWWPLLAPSFLASSWSSCCKIREKKPSSDPICGDAFSCSWLSSSIVSDQQPAWFVLKMLKCSLRQPNEACLSCLWLTCNMFARRFQPVHSYVWFCKIALNHYLSLKILGFDLCNCIFCRSFWKNLQRSTLDPEPFQILCLQYVTHINTQTPLEQDLQIPDCAPCRQMWQLCLQMSRPSLQMFSLF